MEFLYSARGLYSSLCYFYVCSGHTYIIEMCLSVQNFGKYLVFALNLPLTAEPPRGLQLLAKLCIFPLFFVTHNIISAPENILCVAKNNGKMHNFARSCSPRGGSAASGGLSANIRHLQKFWTL
jgi:hypothetical protein